MIYKHENNFKNKIDKNYNGIYVGMKIGNDLKVNIMKKDQNNNR